MMVRKWGRRILRFITSSSARSYAYKVARWNLHWRFRPRSQLEVDTFNGARIRLANTSVSKSFFMVGGTSDPFQASTFLEFLQPGMTAIDCGAHIGEYTLLFAQAVGSSGSVHSFEPDPRLLEYLTQNVALNSLHNVRINGLALADKEGTDEFHMSQDATASSLSRFGAAHLTPHKEYLLGDTVDVQTTTLDAYFDRQPTERIDAIKIDVEGAEAALVSGGLRTLRRHHPGLIFIELDQPDNQSTLESLLEGLGYDMEIRRESNMNPHIIARFKNQQETR